MKQSTVIIGALLIAFFIFITLRGDLPRWTGLFVSQGQHTTNVAGKSGSSWLSTALEIGKTAAEVAAA